MSENRITIKRDEDGNVSVTGNPNRDSQFFAFALGKLISGKFEEISWIPIPDFLKEAPKCDT